jgi:DNA topoisomerase-1
MKLVIVESPAKCSKIQSYLGDGYTVVATMGHIRALQESLDSVGIDRGWEPTYVDLATKRDAINKLKSAAKGCEVILASDDDREGESIAWHVCHILKLNPATTPRIVFHEITKPAILAAVANPRTVDMAKVNAQQARAMLDLLVGFTISKVLWNRVAPKLSAGRCQSPALRLVVERDAEVEQHRASAFWRLNATLQHPTAKKQTLVAAADAEFQTRDQSLSRLQALHTKPNFTVTAVKESVSISQPPKPLITSTLQQEASSIHGLNPKVTMQAAQKLYEAGHITYMRTDNPALSQEAAAAIRKQILSMHGEEYVGAPGQHTIPVAGTEAAPVAEKKKKKAAAAPETPQAQAAHEAIRPTHPDLDDTEIADATQRTVYRLIWRRAMQSQMSAALKNVRITVLEDETGDVWTTEQTKMMFIGYRALERQDAEKTAEEQAGWTAWATVLQPGASLVWTAIRADEHFTKPKGRYTEASLIADLEKRGIGRPSTFASLVSTILDRDYVEKTNVEGATQESHHLVVQPRAWPPSETTQSHKVGAEKNKLRSTPLGRSVSDFLHKEYNDLFAYEFTARMESDLDAIAQAAKPWKTLLQETWDTYKERYTAMTTGGSAAAKAARERVLADGLKIILSKKGPLFVRDPPAGSPKTAKASFAPVAQGMQYESVTAADAEHAFAAAQESRAGELLGAMEDGEEIRKKKGPYGFYAECGDTRVPLRGGETLEQVVEKIKAKRTFAAAAEGGEAAAAYERKLGDFTIKRGPYGLYFYKHTLKRVTFVTFPKTLDPDKVVLADMATLYSDGLSKKKRGFKPKEKT